MLSGFRLEDWCRFFESSKAYAGPAVVTFETGLSLRPFCEVLGIGHGRFCVFVILQFRLVYVLNLWNARVLLTSEGFGVICSKKKGFKV